MLFPLFATHLFLLRILPRLRAAAFFLISGVRFCKLGAAVKVRGIGSISVGRSVSLGDFCWVEAVENYKGHRYTPELLLGDHVAISDLTHISCAKYVRIGKGCLLGSKIYIGDHSHGSSSPTRAEQLVPPAKRPLSDLAPIVIGDNVWIGDGVVVLAGAEIPDGSIVGANSVVTSAFDRAAVIAGVPARVIRYLDG